MLAMDLKNKWLELSGNCLQSAPKLRLKSVRCVRQGKAFSRKPSKSS